MVDEVIILAAGTGSRMAEITINRPKCMAPFLDGTILSRLLFQLKDFKPSKVHIVGGHQFDVLKHYVQQDSFSALNINLLRNKLFATTNSLISASIALSEARGQLLIFNSDVVYDQAIVRKFYDSALPFAFSLDRTDYNEESEKIALDADNRVTQIAKTIAQTSAAGCSADLYRVNTETADGRLNKILSRFSSRPNAGRQLFEDFLDHFLLIQDFAAIDVSGHDWYEIDTVSELNDAETNFRQAI